MSFVDIDKPRYKAILLASNRSKQALVGAKTRQQCLSVELLLHQYGFNSLPSFVLSEDLLFQPEKLINNLVSCLAQSKLSHNGASHSVVTVKNYSTECLGDAPLGQRVSEVLEKLSCLLRFDATRVGAHLICRYLCLSPDHLLVEQRQSGDSGSSTVARGLEHLQMGGDNCSFMLDCTLVDAATAPGDISLDETFIKPTFEPVSAVSTASLNVPISADQEPSEVDFIASELLLQHPGIRQFILPRLADAVFPVATNAEPVNDENHLATQSASTGLIYWTAGRRWRAARCLLRTATPDTLLAYLQPGCSVSDAGFHLLGEHLVQIATLARWSDLPMPSIFAASATTASSTTNSTSRETMRVSQMVEEAVRITREMIGRTRLVALTRHLTDSLTPTLGLQSVLNKSLQEKMGAGGGGKFGVVLAAVATSYPVVCPQIVCQLALDNRLRGSKLLTSLLASFTVLLRIAAWLPVNEKHKSTFLEAVPPRLLARFVDYLFSTVTRCPAATTGASGTDSDDELTTASLSWLWSLLIQQQKHASATTDDEGYSGGSVIRQRHASGGSVDWSLLAAHMTATLPLSVEAKGQGNSEAKHQFSHLTTLRSPLISLSLSVPCLGRPAANLHALLASMAPVSGTSVASGSQPGVGQLLTVSSATRQSLSYLLRWLTERCCLPEAESEQLCAAMKHLRGAGNNMIIDENQTIGNLLQKFSLPFTRNFFALH